MTVQIELTLEEEAFVRKAAAQQGLDTEEFVREAALEKAEKSNGGDTEPRMLDQMLQGLTGLVRSNDGHGGSRLSECTGADFAEDLVRRRRGEP